MADQALTPSQWFTVTWFGCLSNFAAIRNFRRIAALGVPEAKKAFYKEGYRVPEFLKEISSGKWKFPDETIFEHDSRDRMGALMRDNSIAKGQNAVDAASLVFGHSILDHCVNECCRISAAARIEDWELHVASRKIAIADVKGQDYAALLRQMVNAYVEEQERGASLVKRIDLLNQKCQPIPPFEHLGQPYSYKRDRIARIDLRRQEIIHRIAFSVTQDSIDEDLDYLDATAAYVMRLVNYKCRLPLEFEFWMKHSQETTKES